MAKLTKAENDFIEAWGVKPDGKPSIKHPITLTLELGLKLFNIAGKPDNFTKEISSNPYGNGKIAEALIKTLNASTEKNYAILDDSKEAKAEFLLANMDKHDLKAAKLKQTTSNSRKDINLDEIRTYIINNPESLQELFSDYIQQEEEEEETEEE